MPGPATKAAYRNILNAHVGPVLGDRNLATVAQARDDVIDLLTIRLGEGLGGGPWLVVIRRVAQ